MTKQMCPLVGLALFLASPLCAAAGDAKGDYLQLLAAHDKLVAALDARDKAAAPFGAAAYRAGEALGLNLLEKQHGGDTSRARIG